jgi:hypothetical protein
MAEIRESDLMLMCLEASKSIVADYNQEINNALKRISMAMAGGEEVVVTRVEENPVERDIVDRVVRDTLELVLGVIQRKEL